MFTGIIKNTGEITALAVNEQNALLTIRKDGLFTSAEMGASVAVNGTCLTIIEFSDDEATFELGPETMKMTSFNDRKKGDQVNLEFPLTLSDGLGGHFVQGHVDGIGEVIAVKEEGNTKWMTIKLPEALRRFTINKGSITIDGVSLTIAEKREDVISIMLMDYTLDKTILNALSVGDKVNVEADMLAKYIQNLIPKSAYANE